MKRKIRREEQKDIAIFRGVFDRKTLLILYHLLNKGIYKEIIGIVKEGKESVILTAKTKDEKYLAVKIYRTFAIDFKSMWRYLIGDPRFSKVKKSRVAGSESIIDAWCRREFKNLQLAYHVGVNCPKPVIFKDNVLVMDFIGEDNIPAPRLVDTKLKNYKEVYGKVLSEITKLIKTGIVHGDLSAYNILFLKKPYIIDLSHGTPVDSNIAEELLVRDIENVNKFFEKKGVEIKSNETILKQLNEIIEKKR